MFVGNLVIFATLHLAKFLSGRQFTLGGFLKKGPFQISQSFVIGCCVFLQLCAMQKLSTYSFRSYLPFLPPRSVVLKAEPSFGEWLWSLFLWYGPDRWGMYNATMYVCGFFYMYPFLQLLRTFMVRTGLYTMKEEEGTSF